MGCDVIGQAFIVTCAVVVHDDTFRASCRLLHLVAVAPDGSRCVSCVAPVEIDTESCPARLSEEQITRTYDL